jgi:hypothetical protein
MEARIPERFSMGEKSELDEDSKRSRKSFQRETKERQESDSDDLIELSYTIRPLSPHDFCDSTYSP